MPTLIADRMTKDERMDIYRWSGEGYTLREICKMFNNRSPSCKRARIPTVEAVLAMPEAHKFVAKFRMEFLKTVKDIPVAEKKVRLDDLESLRQRLMHIVNNCHLERGDKNISRFLTVSRRLIEVLDIARNEMEQRPGVSIGIGFGNDGGLSELTDEQLQQQRDDLIRRAYIAEQRRTSVLDEITEGDGDKNKPGPPEVLLAAPEELRREELPGSKPDVPDV